MLYIELCGTNALYHPTQILRSCFLELIYINYLKNIVPSEFVRLNFEVIAF